MDTVEQRPLARGLRISRIGLGTVQFGFDYGFTRAFDQGLVDDILARCESLGVNFLDTARGYGDSEEKIGRYLRRHPGSGFLVCTKLDQITPRQAEDASELRACVARSARASREALGLDRLPLLLLHQTDRFLLESDRFWDAVSDLRAEGLFDAFGVSLYDVADADLLLSARREVACFQVPYNVIDRRFAAAARRMKEAGALVVGRSAFLKGMLTAPEAEIPDWLAGLRPALGRFRWAAARKGFTPAALALLFALGTGCVDATVLGVASADELQRDVDALGRMDGAAEALADLAGIAVDDPSLYDPRRWPQNAFQGEDKHHG